MTTLAQVPDMQVIRQGCGTYTYEVLLVSAIVKSCSHNISGVWGAMEARCTTVLNRCLRFVCIISFARARLFFDTQVQELRSKLVKAESAIAPGGNTRSAADAAELEQLRRKLDEALRNEERLKQRLLEVLNLAL